MSIQITFGQWDSSVQELPSQKAKLIKAKKLSPTSLDIENQSGIFKGSGKKPYETTLNDCTCKNFAIEKFPCKHMYSLAITLGLIDKSDIDDTVPTVPTVKKLTVKDKAKKYLEQVGEKQAETIYNLFYDLQHGKTIIRTRNSVPDYVFEYGIFTEVQNDRVKLSKLTKSVLSEWCPVKLPSKSSKDMYVDAILESKPDVAVEYCQSVVLIDLSDTYRDMAESLKRHLLKFYPSVKKDLFADF